MPSTANLENKVTIRAAKTLLTPEEYLLKEREAEFKSEFRDGQIIAMPGASRHHCLISGNIFAELHIQLRDGHCEVYMNDMRVKIPKRGIYTYPDVVVVCDEPLFEDDHFDNLLNPTVIVEVLSPSTEDYDRNEKFSSYQTIESLQEYILVAQDDVHVEQHVRKNGKWDLTIFTSLNDLLQLGSIACQLAIKAIYEKVRF